MDTLVQSLEIKGLRFRNRMIHAPTTMNMSDPLGHPTDKMVGVYESVARGGAAATIVGATCVRRDGLINERMLGLYDDTYVIGYRDLVDAIKHNGSLSGIQLFYGGLIPGLGTTVPLAPGQGWIPETKSWGPSAFELGNPQPMVIPTEEYDDIVECYGQAARRAQEAGFDFLSFHFCHGSLPHANLSLLANVGSDDEYADRFRMVEKIIQRTQELCGKDYPIIPRLCVDENLKGGYDIEYFVEHYAPRLHALGIAVLDCTFGSMFPVESRNPEITAFEYIGPTFYTPHAVNLGNIAQLRKALQAKGIDMPLIGSANLGTPEHLREMVADGYADFAATCRLSMDDPEHPNKIMQGREDDIRKSTRTGASLLQGNIFGKGWAGSAQNPDWGRERDYRIIKTAEPKKVVVVGGGSGGMEYAITAKRIGHDVLVLEKNNFLGGTMDWAGNYQKIPNMEMIRYQPDYHRRQFAKLEVPHCLGCDAGLEEIVAENPDVVVLATGVKYDIPDAIGMQAALASGMAITIEQAMSRDNAPDLGANPIIFGSGIGGELAADLSMRGLPVRLLETQPEFTPANYLGSRGVQVQVLLERAKVSVEGDCSLLEVGPDWIRVMINGVEQTLPCSSLILALGRQSENSLEAQLHKRGFLVQVLGDARQPRSYANAIHEAAYLARQI